MATKKKSEAVVEEQEQNQEQSQEAVEIADLKAQIAKLQEMLASQSQPIEEKKSSKKAIKFVNLGTGTVVLKGTRFWEISGQFNSRMIPEAEARAIVSNSPNLLTSGVVCVPDPEFLAEYDIDVNYDVLSEKELRSLLTKSADNISYIYQNTSDEQKQIIVNMIIERKHKNQYVDANVLVEISKLCGRDLSQVEAMDE